MSKTRWISLGRNSLLDTSSNIESAIFLKIVCFNAYVILLAPCSHLLRNIWLKYLCKCFQLGYRISDDAGCRHDLYFRYNPDYCWNRNDIFLIFLLTVNILVSSCGCCYVSGTSIRCFYSLLSNADMRHSWRCDGVVYFTEDLNFKYFCDFT